MAMVFVEALGHTKMNNKKKGALHLERNSKSKFSEIRSQNKNCPTY
ncbi:hypothetical protein FM107_10870 [Sphingobacterium sp. JB170]|nr:hypothetical protein FM107_10870 [Sphingobacterium sp. JB170]